MPYCVKCGHKVPDGAAFCTACGAPLKKINAAPPQTVVPPQSTPQPTPQPAPPPPPPAPESQPGAFRVTIRKKEVVPPPQRNMTPPPQQQQFVAQPNNGYSKPRRQSSGGSSFGGCLRRAFHGITATIALIASLWWGANSLFPNLRTDFSNWTNGFFGKCSSAHQEGGGLLGFGGKESDAPSAKEYERVFTDDEMTKIFDAGFPKTDEDHGVCFGLYESDQKMQGQNIAFELKKASPGEDKRLVGKFILLIDGKAEQEGFLCYCGHSIYSLFDDLEDIDHANRASGIWYVSADGKSLSIYDKGEEKMKWTLKE